MGLSSGVASRIGVVRGERHLTIRNEGVVHLCAESIADAGHGLGECSAYDDGAIVLATGTGHDVLVGIFGVEKA